MIASFGLWHESTPLAGGEETEGDEGRRNNEEGTTSWRWWCSIVNREGECKKQASGCVEKLVKILREERKPVLKMEVREKRDDEGGVESLEKGEEKGKCGDSEQWSETGRW